MCDPWDSQGNKSSVSNSIAFCVDFLIRNENITSEEFKTKKMFEIILHVGKLQAFKVIYVKSQNSKMCHCQEPPLYLAEKY